MGVELKVDELKEVIAGVVVAFVFTLLYVLVKLEIIDLQKLLTCRRFRKIYVDGGGDNDDDILAWKRNAEIRIKKEGAARVRTREQKEKEKEEKAHAEFMRQAYVKQLAREAQEAAEAAQAAEVARVQAEYEESVRKEIKSWAADLSK